MSPAFQGPGIIYKERGWIKSIVGFLHLEFCVCISIYVPSKGKKRDRASTFVPACLPVPEHGVIEALFSRERWPTSLL